MLNKLFCFINFISILSSSCNLQNNTKILIEPFEFEIHNDIKSIQKQCENRNIGLVYENSYEGINEGVEKYYCNEIIDSIHYYFELFIINNKIEGVEMYIKSMKNDSLGFLELINAKIIPKFRKDIANLEDSNVEIINSYDKNNNLYLSLKVSSRKLINKLK